MSSKQAELRRLMKLQREKKEREQGEQPKRVAKLVPKSILKVKTTQSKPNHGALESLLTGYDSDSEDENQYESGAVLPSKPSRGVSWPSDDAQLKITHTIVIHQEVPLEEFDESANSQPIDATAEDPMVATVSTKNDESSVELNTWKEFEALVGDEDENDHALLQEDQLSSAQSHGDDSEVAPLSLSSITHHSAGAPNNVADDDTTVAEESSTPAEVEQASYEARIAKLRLKAAQRKQKRKQLDSDDDTQFGPTYTPELAFQEPEDETRTNGKRGLEAAALTPLEILKQKRARARQWANRDVDEYDDT